MTLLLFDIDGTLLDGLGAGRNAVEGAFEDVTGRPVHPDGLPFSGKTDPQIVNELLAQVEADAGDDAVAAQILDGYAERLGPALAEKSVDPLPGTRALLERLAERDDVLLGLLTGNLARTAQTKLAAVDLDGFFDFGAFGSDDADRDRLVPFAARRAEAHAGRSFAGHDIVVIGDTPRDVACGQAHQTRTVAVCTGRYGRADLEDAGADHVFTDLSDTDGFIQTILGEQK